MFQMLRKLNFGIWTDVYVTKLSGRIYVLSVHEEQLNDIIYVDNAEQVSVLGKKCDQATASELPCQSHQSFHILYCRRRFDKS